MKHAPGIGHLETVMGQALHIHARAGAGIQRANSSSERGSFDAAGANVPLAGDANMIALARIGAKAAVLEAEVLRADGGSAPVAARNADAKAREAEGALTDTMTDAERLVVAGGMSSAEQLVVGDDPDPMVKELEALEAKRDEYSVEARRARQRARQARRSNRREER